MSMNARAAATPLLLAASIFVGASPAIASSLQSVCSSSALSQTPSDPFATDPPFTGFRHDFLPRCIAGPGSVSSGISSDGGPVGFGPGSLFWDAHSAITVDQATVRFSGYAQVTFNDIGAASQLASYAGTSGTFLDLMTILPPAGVSGHAELDIPMHITGSGSAVGTVVGAGIPHAADFTYDFRASSASFFEQATDTVGVHTTGETLRCNGATCAQAPVEFDRIVLLRFPFVFGEEFFFQGGLSVTASFFLNSDSPGRISGSTTADFSHTMTFGPATVVDASGRVIDGVTILSDIDYLGAAAASPIPEPPPWLLLAAAVSFAPLLRHRMRSRASGVTHRRRRATKTP